MNKKFEYYIISEQLFDTFNENYLTDQLDRAGELGWELASIQIIFGKICLFFKREK